MSLMSATLNLFGGWIRLNSLSSLAKQRGPCIFVCSSHVNAVREIEKSLHVAIGFTLAFHGHVALTTKWNTNTRKLFISIFTLALKVHFTRSRIDEIPALFVNSTRGSQKFKR